jgi:hypothetical protein
LADMLAARDMGARLGKAARSEAFTFAAALRAAEALAEALADALALAEAEALAAKAAATLALMLPSRAASCDMARALSRSRPNRFLASANEVVCAIRGPRPGIAIVGGCMLAAKASAAFNCAAPPGKAKLIPRALAAALSCSASAAFADRLAEAAAEADADADADADVAIEAPTPGIARFTPVKLFRADNADISFISSARAAAAGLSSAPKSAPSPGKLAFMDRAVTLRLATALALNGPSPSVRERLARAFKLAMAEADIASVADADADALALADALAFIAALAAMLSRPTPRAVVRSGPSNSISIASGRFFSWAIMAANWFTHMQGTETSE